VIGFVLSVSVLLFTLLCLVERRPFWRALIVSIGVTVGSYLLFNTLLKSPLPPMPFWS
jgi:xanthine/uracil permease